jgi:hypothetical protein
MTHQQQGRVAVLAVVGLAGLLTAGLARSGGDSRPGADAGGDRQAIAKVLFRSWHEETFEQAGKMHDQPYQLTGWRFAPEEIEVWDYSGDLSPCVCPRFKVHIDPTRRPMRMDVVLERENRRTILPGIFKIEGKRLIWVTPEWHGDWVPVHPSGEYAGRPTDFTSTKANGQDRRVLVPCALYEQAGAR